MEENFTINYFSLTIKLINFRYHAVAVLIEEQKMIMFWVCLTFLLEVCSLHCSNKLLVLPKVKAGQASDHC